MRQHAVLSPSKASRWMACPGSWVLENAYKDDDQGSDYAAEGTRLHGYVSRLLQAAADSTVLDASLGAEDQDNQDAVQFCLDFARSLQADHPGSSLVETSIAIDAWTKEKGAKGSVDFAHYTDSDLWVVDWKFGRGVRVNAERNPQISLYGLGIYEIVKQFTDVRTIHLVIVQPFMDSISDWTISVDELARQGRIIKQKASICKAQRLLPADELTLVPRSDVCQFCKAKADCPALRELAESAFERQGERLTGEELGYWLDRLDSLKQFAKAVEDEGMRRLMTGEPVTGWKLVAGGRGKRVWVDDVGVGALLYELIGDAAYKTETISVAQAEKLTKGKTPKLRKDDWEGLFVPAIRVPDPKPTLAPANDPRDAWVEPEVTADDFDEVKAA